MNWKPVYFSQDRRQALRALARLECRNYPADMLPAAYPLVGWQICVPDGVCAWRAGKVADGSSTDDREVESSAY